MGAPQGPPPDEERAAQLALAHASRCLQQRCPERAIPEVRRLADSVSDPELRAELLWALGQLTEQAGDFADAAEIYARGSRLEPSNTLVRYFLANNEGYCRNQIHDFARAGACCRVAIEIDPRRHNAHKNLGLSLEGQGRLRDAVEAYQEAVDLCPADRRALDQLEALVTREPDLLREVLGLADWLDHHRSRAAAARREVN